MFSVETYLAYVTFFFVFLSNPLCKSMFRIMILPSPWNSIDLC